jgi:hypothetical protein
MSELSSWGPPSSEARKDASSGRHPKVARQDLRRHLRFRVEDASARLHLKGLLTSIGLGRANKCRGAINLSESGALLVVGEMIEVGTKVSVRIEMERFADVIEAEGVVRWCAEAARAKDGFYAGIEFAGLPEADLKRIAHMRDYFGSPEHRARTATRRREAHPTIETDV